MSRTNTKYILFSIAFMLLIINISFADILVDKKGKPIEEVLVPTAETTIDPNTMTDAVRRIVKDEFKDYTGQKAKYSGPSQNIYSKGYIYQGSSSNDDKNSEYTLIRYTASITDVNEEQYELRQDINKDRMRLLIKVAGVGEFEAKNGFYKLDDKVFYFDENGLMVLGPAYDDIGNYYMFSYETGELVEEIQVK